MNKHEENRENDVKENEKSGEMRGICYPKTGDEGPKTGDAGQKIGDLGTPKKAHPLWMHFAKPDQIHNTKSG